MSPPQHRCRSQDNAKAAALEQWLARLVRYHGERILPVDRAVAEEWGRLTAKRVDTLQAVTARVHGLTLATRKEIVPGLSRIGVPHHRASSTSRTLRASSSGVKGFARRTVPESKTP